ncbi:MAG: ATP-dependent DNA helicase RecG, partial [Chloroflexota bacterium]
SAPPPPPPSVQPAAREFEPAPAASPPEVAIAEGERPPAATVETPTPPPPQLRRRPAVAPDPAGLLQPVTVLKGVGPKLAETLERLGVKTIRDLLYLFPRRYDDYTLLKPINRLSYGETVTVIGTIWETRARRKGAQVIVQSVVNDGTGSLTVTWFNQPWLTEKLNAGLQIVLSGTIEQFLGRPVMNQPAWEPLELEPLKTRRIVPVYPLTEGLAPHKLREMTRKALEEWSDRLPDPLPATLLQQRNLYDLPEAIRQIHFPDSQETLHKARQRLTFEELFLLQMGMLGQRKEWRVRPAIPLPADSGQLAAFFTTLPFQLTGAQQRVIGEITGDLAQPVPMNRLLQGDVGSGKTVVAAAAMLVAAQAGAQAALMAPTEILAEQHYRGLERLLRPMGVTVRLLTGSTPAAEKERVYTELADGTAQVAIGTHALIQPNVQFKRLALAVIDEQHRFGVDQRQALRDKGALADDGRPNPHLLVMSATPIPRTLALSLYGDLDFSSLDEMPPGRQEIKTRWLQPSQRERAYAFVRRQVESGRQAFIICPLVEESDKIDAASAIAEHARLQEKIFPDLKLGLVHGRLKADEKEAAMRAFYQGETDVLVATAVIEVGIDVPNSTVILIEGANRFGLAQLHQFRGRVGRGEYPSYCLLLADSSDGDVEDRLTAMEQTTDGFLLAEKDLELRGPGEFFGRRQSGLPELRLASLLDMQGLTAARQEAQAIFEKDPDLAWPEHRLLKEQVAHFWQQGGDVS